VDGRRGVLGSHFAAGARPVVSERAVLMEVAGRDSGGNGLADHHFTGLNCAGGGGRHRLFQFAEVEYQAGAKLRAVQIGAGVRIEERDAVLVDEIVVRPDVIGFEGANTEALRDWDIETATQRRTHTVVTAESRR